MDKITIFMIIMGLLFVVSLFSIIMINNELDSCEQDKSELEDILSECQYLLAKLVEPYIDEIEGR